MGEYSGEVIDSNEMDRKVASSPEIDFGYRLRVKTMNLNEVHKQYFIR